MNGYFIINQQEVGLWGCSERLSGRAQKSMRFCEELNQTIVSADRVCRSGEVWSLPTWSNSFFCLSLSPSASAIIRRSFLSSASCFSMKCLVSRACCLSFCSSAWQQAKDTDRFHSVTSQTRSAGPRLRWIVCFWYFPVMSRLAWFDHPHKQRKLNTHTHTHTHTHKACKETTMHISVIMFILSCALEGFPSFFYISIAGTSFVFNKQFSYQLNMRKIHK